MLTLETCSPLGEMPASSGQFRYDSCRRSLEYILERVIEGPRESTSLVDLSAYPLVVLSHPVRRAAHHNSETAQQRRRPTRHLASEEPQSRKAVALA
jgi:hypothetical protein